jgi:hypothetical protein
MTRTSFGSCLAVLTVSVAFGASARAQDEGIKQVEALTKKCGATVEAIANTKAQLMRTADVYNSLMAEDAKDQKGLYKKLQSEMATTEKRRAEISVRASDMKTEADALFKSWADAAVGISDASLRKRSEDRLAKTKASYEEMGVVAQKAADLYGPVMRDLEDQVTFLGHDLNPSAIASLKPNAAKVNGQVSELAKRIDDTITSANATCAALKAQ